MLILDRGLRRVSHQLAALLLWGWAVHYDGSTWQSTAAQFMDRSEKKRKVEASGVYYLFYGHPINDLQTSHDTPPGIMFGLF